MGVEIVPPARREPGVSSASGVYTLRSARFFEEVADAIGVLPDVIPDIADLSGPADATANMNKINEILAALRTAGIMA